MRVRSFRVVVLGAAFVGLTLGMQACTNGDKAPAPFDAGASTNAGTPSTDAGGEAGNAPGEAGGKSGNGSAGGKTGKATVRYCTNDDVTVEVDLQPSQGDGAQRGLVAVTNRSATDCTVDGRASISLRNAADEVVDVPVKNVKQPGSAAPIVLKPGTSAFEGIKWVPCDKDDVNCGAGNSLSFNLQASTDGPAADLVGFPAPEKHNITMKSLQVGTLQPVTQGVVAW